MARPKSQRGDNEDAAFPITFQTLLPPDSLGGVPAEAMIWLSVLIGSEDYRQELVVTAEVRIWTVRFRQCEDLHRLLETFPELRDMQANRHPG